MGTKYLGLNLDFSQLKSHLFRELRHQVIASLANWKILALSMMGQVTVAKHVLSSLALYTVFIFYIPKTIVRIIDKYITRFIWVGVVEGKEIHWKAWDFICCSKFQGGLGLKSTKEINRALLAKATGISYLIQNHCSVNSS